MDPTTAISRKKSVDPGDVEKQPLMIEESFSKEVKTSTPREEQAKTNGISAMGLKVLALLACQNAFKNILMRVVMKDHAGFLLSTAIIIVEILKLLFSCTYIVLVQKRSPLSIILYIKQDWKNTVLLAVPATVYSLQMTLEYIAMANIDPASYSVLVQMKMLTTAFFFRILLKKRYMKKQFMSLVILTVGVMLCNMKTKEEENNEEQIGNKMKGIAATLGKSGVVMICDLALKLHVHVTCVGTQLYVSLTTTNMEYMLILKCRNRMQFWICQRLHGKSHQGSEKNQQHK
jgi:hypothetical protein